MKTGTERHIPHVYVKSKIVKLREPESIMVVVRGWEEEKMK